MHMSLRGAKAYKFLGPLSSKAGWKHSNALFMTFSASLYQGRFNAASGLRTCLCASPFRKEVIRSFKRLLESDSEDRIYHILLVHHRHNLII